VHIAFVRSTHAHTRIVDLKIDSATQAPGVFTVLTATDLINRVNPICAKLEATGSDPYFSTNWYPVARNLVRYVGEILAIIVASDRYCAEDAADLVEIAYDSLPAVIDAHQAIENESPTVHSHIENNVLFRTHRVVSEKMIHLTVLQSQ